MGGAVTGYRAFSSVFTTGDTTHYVLSDGTNWEVGLGTLTTGTPWTMARTTILSSSNAGAVVNFPGPTTNVWVDGSAKQLSVAPQFSGQITSTVATGTAPLVVASTTTVANLAAATATTATSATTAAGLSGASPALGTQWQIDSNNQLRNNTNTLYVGAWRSSATTTSGTVVNTSTLIAQQGSNFTNSSGTVTVVAIGLYLVTATVDIVSSNTNTNLYFGVSGGTVYGPTSANPWNVLSQTSAHATVTMTAYFLTSAASQTIAITSGTTFTGSFYANLDAQFMIARVA